MAGIALGGIREADEDVPRRGDDEEDRCAGDGVEAQDAGDGSANAAGEDEVHRDDGDGEDEADESLGENSEGAGGSAAKAEPARWDIPTHPSPREGWGTRALWLISLFSEPVAEDGES